MTGGNVCCVRFSSAQEGLIYVAHQMTKMKCTKRLSKSQDRGIFTLLEGSSSYKVQMFSVGRI